MRMSETWRLASSLVITALVTAIMYVSAHVLLLYDAVLPMFYDLPWHWHLEESTTAKRPARTMLSLPRGQHFAPRNV